MFDQFVGIDVNYVFKMTESEKKECLYSFIELLLNSKSILSCRLKFRIPGFSTVIDSFGIGREITSDKIKINYESQINKVDSVSCTPNEIKFNSLLKKLHKTIIDNRNVCIFKVVEKFIPPVLGTIVCDYVFGLMCVEIYNGKFIFHEESDNRLDLDDQYAKYSFDPTCIVVEQRLVKSNW